MGLKTLSIRDVGLSNWYAGLQSESPTSRPRLLTEVLPGYQLELQDILHRLSLSSARRLSPSDTLVVQLGNAWAAVAQDAVSGHDVNVACLKTFSSAWYIFVPSARPPMLENSHLAHLQLPAGLLVCGWAL